MVFLEQHDILVGGFLVDVPLNQSMQGNPVNLMIKLANSFITSDDRFRFGYVSFRYCRYTLYDYDSVDTNNIAQIYRYTHSNR